MEKTNIFIGYNQKLFFEGLSLMFNETDEFHVAGGCVNGEAIFKYSGNHISVVLLELDTLKKCDLEYLKNVREFFNGLPTIIVSRIISSFCLDELVEIDPEGLLLKSCSKKDLINAMGKVIDGDKFYCHKITQLIFADYQKKLQHDNHLLSPREEQVLMHVVNGETSSRIAGELKISETTVKTHRKNIMDKLGATNVFELVRYSCRENLITRQESGFCKSCPCIHVNQ